MENLNNKNILPKLIEIPITTLGFINSQGFINSFNNHAKLQDLSIQLNSNCTHLQSHLNDLHSKLSTLLVSCISQSIKAKSSLDDFILNLENLSIISSYYGNNVERRKIEKMVDKDLVYIAKELRRIDNIRQYVEVVIKLEALVGDLEDVALSAVNQHAGHIFSRTHRSSCIPGDFSGNLNNVQCAVKAINTIEEVLFGVTTSNPQWCNLLKTVDARVNKILSSLRPQVIADHRSLLVSLGWPPKLVNTNMLNGDDTSIPNPLILMKGAKKESYSQSFLALCALQHVHLRREERQYLVKKLANIKLWAIDELVSPFASKIEHHLFKWTDQPELMFALVYKVTRDFIEGVDDVLQPLIDRARLVSCSAKESWVSAMMQVLSVFLEKNVFPILAVRYRDKSARSDVISSWLHLIDHIVKFDKQMQSLVTSESYVFMGGTSTELVRSMSVLTLFCDRPDWVHIWAKIELKDAWSKLKAQLKDEKAWSTGRKYGTQETDQYCLLTGEDHKAPQVAEFALKTSWELIERCQTLPGTARRIQFIKSGPTKFIWQFLKILHSRHSSIEFPSYDFGESLVRICQLVNAARFSEFKLREWSDDVDLLELSLAAKGQDSNFIADGTSSPFFYEEIDSLIEMQTNWVMEIITHILRHFEDTSSCYFHNTLQFELTPSGSHEGNIVISSDLVITLDNLRGQLLLVKDHLNANDFLDSWRSVAEGLDHYIFRTIISHDVRFSKEGAKQFMADMEGLFLVFKAFCARPEAFFPCIRDFLKLLRLGKEEVMGLKINLLDSAECSSCLLSHSISRLSVDQALQILNNTSF